MASILLGKNRTEQQSDTGATRATPQSKSTTKSTPSPIAAAPEPEPVKTTKGIKFLLTRCAIQCRRTIKTKEDSWTEVSSSLDQSL